VTESDIEHIKTQVKFILKNYPDDYTRVAETLGWTRARVVEFLKDNQDIVEELRDGYLDSITSSYKRWVRGDSVGEEFSGVHALKILERERPEIWSPKGDERNAAKRASESKNKPLLFDLDFSQQSSDEVEDLEHTSKTLGKESIDFVKNNLIMDLGEQLGESLLVELEERTEFLSVERVKSNDQIVLGDEDLYSISESRGVDPLGSISNFVAEDDMITIEDI
jgi:hypothetical protein